MTDCEKYIQAINELSDELAYLKEAITTIQKQYELQTHIEDQPTQLKATLYLHCIKEIKKQYELIKLREQGGKV